MQGRWGEGDRGKVEEERGERVRGGERGADREKGSRGGCVKGIGEAGIGRQ